ncbi:MAG: 50S ribosomal protein L6 [Nitrospira sp.]|nr:50S ribosomal protein L6 [Nitrospira sp.]
MSRIGKKPIDIPKGVEVTIADRLIRVKGSRGELSWTHPEKVKVSIVNGTIVVKRASDSKHEKALHGLTRSIIANMVIGVSQGYQRVLDIVGIGYKAQVIGNKLAFSLGYAHPVEVQLPEGVKASLDAKQTQITLTGIDKHQLGQVAANLRFLRQPDSYKGKGVRYSGELLRLKVGKTGKK